MSKMASKSTIGAFVVGAIALAVIAVVIFGSGKFFKQQLEFIMYFQGSIKGLDAGSPVTFRGVKIGEVKDITLQVRPSDLTFFIPVIVEIDPDRIQQMGESGLSAKPQSAGIGGRKARYANIQALIDKGLRAQLASQSFVTGQLAVSLDFFPEKPPVMVGLDKRYHEIPTVPTMFQDLEKALKEFDLKGIVEDVKSTMQGINGTVNSPEIQKTLKSVSEAAEEARKMMKTVNSQVGPLVTNANETMKDVQKMVQTLERQVGPLASGANETVKDVQKMVQNLDRQVATLLPTVETTVKDAQGLVKHLDGRIDPIASNLEETLKAISNLVNHDVKNLIGNVDQGVARVMPELAKSLEQLRETLVGAEGALRSFEGSTGSMSPLIYQLTKTLEEVSNTVQSLRSLTDYLQRHPESLIKGKD
jgi:paraquat-inducible protein B